MNGGGAPAADKEPALGTRPPDDPGVTDDEEEAPRQRFRVF
ncbi:hypothetical protein [Propylenella binzhouense]|nr:hypothetical protein [Propylenella binzhouense]